MSIIKPFLIFLLLISSIYASNFNLREFFDGEWSVHRSKHHINPLNKEFIELSDLEFEFGFDENNQTQFIIDEYSISLKIECFNEFHCTIEQTTANIQDIFDDSEEVVTIDLNLIHDQRIKKFITRGSTNKYAFEFIAASSISFQFYEIPFNQDDNNQYLIEYHAIKSASIAEKTFWQKYHMPILFVLVMVALQFVKAWLKNAQAPPKQD